MSKIKGKWLKQKKNEKINEQTDCCQTFIIN